MCTFCRIMLFAAVFVYSGHGAFANTLYESATLGKTGFSIEQIRSGEVSGLNVHRDLFLADRFELSTQALITQIGGHFLSAEDDGGGTIFGAIVPLANSSSFPDFSESHFSSAIGSTSIQLPKYSADVYGNLKLHVNPGWYAVVFGSGLFGTEAYAGTLRNNPDIGMPSRLQKQAVLGGWHEQFSNFDSYRFVILGTVVPEPNTKWLIATGMFAFFVFQLVKRRYWCSANSQTSPLQTN